MPRCIAIKLDGSPCERIVGASQSYCYAHDPSNADKRRRDAAKAGRSKPSRELVGIKQRLSDLADDVLTGEVERGVGAVASQILNVYLRAVSVELKVREQLELTERLGALEEALEQQKADRWYGA